jgi:FkbM family methyltransferase
MNNILIDCGGNLGQGFRELESILGINDTWKVIIFEPNPHCIQQLKHNIKGLDYIEIVNKAVATNNNLATLFIPNNSNVSQGATIDGVKFLEDSVRQTIGGYGENFEVECINLSEYISKLDGESIIHLKMDIEGGEYAILEHMIFEKTLSRVTKLYVEFHNRFVDDDKRKEFDERRDNILLHIKNTDIQFTEWH